MARSQANASRSSCMSTRRLTRQLVLSFFALTTAPLAATSRSDQQAQVVFGNPPLIPPLIPEPPPAAEHTFTLRHVLHHGIYKHPGLFRKMDVTHPEAEVWMEDDDGVRVERILPLKAKSEPRKIERLIDRRPEVVEPMVSQARERGYVLASEASTWTMDHVPGPNITDKETVLTMALVAANAYVALPDMPDWEEVGHPFNKTEDFGWETDGLRGHIWADRNNSTVIIGLKGTSVAVFDGEETTTNDKINDNLFFSCCCGQQGQWTYRQVCDCATGTYKCNTTCVRNNLRQENRYYQAAMELYSNVTEIYPASNIWLVGHSLGGALSSLVGLTYGLPVVTFEAVPEALPAGRLGLPAPPHSDPEFPQTRQYTGSYHFGHTADPIYIGTCNGATASCTYGGYALESACHTGYECTYDTVGDKGWRVGIGTHRIKSVIHDVIRPYDDVPPCKLTPECRDCANWKMYESNSTEGTTTSSSSTASKTRTRTETCQTPGWWGCLDETTTTGTATSTSAVTATTTSTSTSTCETPGWFGCKDETTTASSTTTTATTTPSSTTTSCKTPGWFGGCYDQTTSLATPSPIPTQPLITSPPLIPSATVTSTISNTPQPTAAPQWHCQDRAFWFLWCRRWEPSLMNLGFEAESSRFHAKAAVKA